MAIETTYGHGHLGVVGQTLKPETLKVWAHSLRACNELIKGLDEMENHNVKENVHKEEMAGRIEQDMKDRILLSLGKAYGKTSVKSFLVASMTLFQMM